MVDGDGKVVLDKDEHPRPGTTLEALSGLELANPDLREVSRAVLDIWAQYPDLDAVGLQDHLRSLGFAENLTRILSKRIYDLCPFARPDADADWVRAGWQEALAVHRDRLGEAEKAEAARQLAENMDDRALKRLDAHKQMLQDSARAAVDGDTKS